MHARVGHRRRLRHEALLDAGAVASAALLLVFASTSFNRIPYPGARRYAHPAVRPVLFAVPIVSDAPAPSAESAREWLVEDSQPLFDSDAVEE